MREYLVKQHFTFGGEKFTISDSQGRAAYFVEGSFFEIPKRFIISDSSGNPISHITKTFLTFLPQFTIEMANGHSFYLKKEFTFFKDRYKVENLGLVLKGNIWDLEFSLYDAEGQLVAVISKELLHLTSHYRVAIHIEHYQDLVMSLVIALDYVEMLENTSN